MMGGHHNMLSFTFCNTFYDELFATLMFCIEIIRCKTVVIAQYLIEIIQSSLHLEHINLWNMRPQSGEDEVSVANCDHLIIIIAYILAKHPLPSLTSFSNIPIVIIFMIARNEHHLLIRSRSPVQKPIGYAFFQIGCITSQHKDITSYFQRM